ncbi:MULTISPECIES: phospholipase D family protein [Bordetella]|uniref:phospholipase D family protein n=1 Tax=Bordetella TaxID=517 RepID=UPI0004B57491|nr:MULTISPECIES: phospholipase D family protein [Bordetella]
MWLKQCMAALGLAMLVGCSLPPQQGRTESSALPAEQARQTALGRAIAPLADAHPGLSGIYALADARAAFAARALLLRAAEKTLDVQYYIWRGDMTGTLLLEALYDAAERGVRVRLLLDDNGVAGLDDVLAALDSHPNIEVRLFNPFVIRRPKMLGYLTDFSRLNRRMHNKSFTADSQATIIGGRNIGDEYFGAADDVLFADLDLLAVGQVVGDVSNDFDRYWASESAYPIAALLGPADTSPLQALHESAEQVEQNPAASAYMQAMRDLPFIGQMLEGKLAFEWAPTRMVSDDPSKVSDPSPGTVTLVDQLKQVVGEPATELELVSPYFVPTEAGTAALTQMVRRGVRVQVLTNAYEATDVAVVHSGYVRQRKALLRGGVQLYEMRGQPDGTAPAAGPLGSSGSSLHAKTFSVDRQSVFVGSFNFDPRSINLNTELGFVVDSPVLAAQMADLFDQDVARHAYRVELEPDGSLYWIEEKDGVQHRHDTEPGTVWWQRWLIWFLSLLPIEPLL